MALGLEAVALLTLALLLPTSAKLYELATPVVIILAASVGAALRGQSWRPVLVIGVTMGLFSALACLLLVHLGRGPDVQTVTTRFGSSLVFGAATALGSWSVTRLSKPHAG